jgi:thiol-disulfide isomerase/thioredoxin
MDRVLTLADNRYKVIKFSGNRADFATLIDNNPGILIFKFTAEWCGPCKKIKEYTYNKSNDLPNHITMLEVDVDECFDLYAFLKHKKMVNGIPVFLAYARGINEGPIASITGASLPDIETFFATCINYTFSNKN